MTNPLHHIEGRAIPLGRNNIDTDVIIPARFLKTLSREGLGAAAFADLRKEPGNLFDDPAYAGAPILIAGDNFGCGSSREHAAWALHEMGIQAVIAPSFSDIFLGNAFRNGILTIALPPKVVEHLLAIAREGAGDDTPPIRIDLAAQTITTFRQDRIAFAIDPRRKAALLSGLDEVGVTLAHSDAIAAHEARIAQTLPWLATPGLAG